jgi:uncharacterized membrane protein YfcA
MDLSAIPGLASPWVAAAIALIVVAAAIVQFGLGMGFGLMAAPLLALIDPQLVPAPTLIIGMVTSFWAAWRERQGIRWDEVGIGTIGRVAGVAAAVTLLSFIADQRHFMLVFGILVGLAVLISLAGRRIPFNRFSLVAMSGVSGLMATITSVGAPPLALIYQDRSADAARPTLAAFFAVGCVIALAGLSLGGWLTVHHWVLAALMVPPMLVGFAISRRLKGRVDRSYRPALLSLAGIAAVMLILRGLA